jgi:hypothetical protein
MTCSCTKIALLGLQMKTREKSFQSASAVPHCTTAFIKSKLLESYIDYK